MYLAGVAPLRPVCAGWARACRPWQACSRVCAPSSFDYMAPELLMGQPCTNRVDIYSYGVLMHEICTGAHFLWLAELHSSVNWCAAASRRQSQPVCTGSHFAA